MFTPASSLSLPGRAKQQSWSTNFNDTPPHRKRHRPSLPMEDGEEGDLAINFRAQHAAGLPVLTQHATVGIDNLDAVCPPSGCAWP